MKYGETEVKKIERCKCIHELNDQSIHSIYSQISGTNMNARINDSSICFGGLATPVQSLQRESMVTCGFRYPK